MNRIAKRLMKVAMPLTKDTLKNILTPDERALEYNDIFYFEHIKDFFEQAFKDDGKQELGYGDLSFDEAANAYADELSMGNIDLSKDQLLILPNDNYIAGDKDKLVDALYEYLTDDPDEKLWNNIVKRMDYLGH